jgi:hypothetical protein
MPKIMRCAIEWMFLEVKTMKYEAPGLRILPPAITVIQSSGPSKGDIGLLEMPITVPPREPFGAYEDWE